MQTQRSRFVPLVGFVAFLTACAAPARAQVPDGFAVICTYTDPTLTSGAPGLFLQSLDPNNPITIPVTGLPANLATNGNGNYGQGGFAVSIRSDDGAVIVSTIAGAAAPNGGEVELFVLHLNVDLALRTAAVAQTQRFVLGRLRRPDQDITRVVDLGRSLHRALPGPDVFVVAFSNTGVMPAGPMVDRVFAILDTSTGAITPLSNPPIRRAVVGGIAVDPSGTFAYYAVSTAFFSAASNAELHRVDLTTTPGLAPDCIIATFPGETVGGIACDDDGSIYVASYRDDPTTPTSCVHRVRPDGCNPAAVTTLTSNSTTPLLTWGLDLDRASGCFVVGSVHGRQVPPPTHVLVKTVALIDPATGNVTPIFVSSNGALGLQGVAVNNAIESYGAPTPGQHRYWFENFPNPGGQPTVGNATFSLTMLSDPGPPAPAPSALAISLGRGQSTVLGAAILVDPASAVLILVPAGPPATYLWPIPPVAGLRGLTLTAQSLHLEAPGVLATSRGLSLTVQ